MAIQKKIEAKDDLVTLTSSYKEEAKNAKANRMRLNRTNYDCYHLRQDWSHKRKGQSREFLAKQPMAVEQISTFIQQGLVDSGDWFGVEKSAGAVDAVLTESEVKAIMKWAFDKCDFLTYVGDSVKDCLLQSLAITKNHGCYKPKAYFYTEVKEKGGKFVDVLKRETRDYWCPKLELLRAEDYYPDPSGKGLYVIHETYMDISELYAMSEGPYAVYDRSKVEMLHGTLMESDMQAAKKARETAQNTSINGYRKKVKINECWGTILEPATGKVIKKDVVWTIADDRIVIQEPTDYPFWHNMAPLIAAAFIRVPRSVWHKALMDAPTQTNIALNELYNLMVDAGMNDAHGIKQIRADWLEDESQVSNGIYPGITLKVNSQCPPGARVLERVDTSSMSSEALNVFNTMSAEFSASALTNDLRMGVLPNRAVKATEVVEASQSITSVFTGISKVLEQTHIEPNMNMMFANILQHFMEIDPAEMMSVLGEERFYAIQAMGKEVLFSKAFDGFKFKVFGISKIMAKQKDFRKFTALLQTIASSDLLVEEFIKQYSMGKFLGKIIKSLDINEDEIKVSEEDKMMSMMAQSMAAMPSQQGPDMQSQIPQAGAQQSAETVESMIPRADFGGLQGKAEGGMG
jgi:hypothetical protein